LCCVVRRRQNEQGRSYRLPTEGDLEAVTKAAKELEKRKKAHIGPLSLVPNETISLNEIRRISAPIYGMSTWGDLFTPRQLLGLTTLGRLVREAGTCLGQETKQERLAEATHLVLALCASKLADLLNSLCSWQPTNDRATHLFARQSIQMTWDFAESTGAADAVGNFGVAINNIARILEREAQSYSSGQAEKYSA